MVRHLLELGDGVLGSFHDLIGVNANRGEDLGMTLGQGEGRPAGFKVCADRDHSGHPGLDGPTDNRIAVGIKVGKIEMAMGVDQHFNLQIYNNQNKNKGD